MTMTPFREILTSLPSLFSLIVTFFLTKIENKTKKPLTQLSYYCFEYVFLPKNVTLTSAKLKGIFSETHMCMCNYVPNLTFLA